MQLYEKYKTLFDKWGDNSPLRIANFMAQVEHESNLKPICENLNYSSEGLTKIFGKYFTPATAPYFSRNPEKIANKVYANRMGNGDEASGDGWKYKGRGFIQLTGKSNYSQLSKDSGIDFINNPDLLLDESNAIIGALWFWKKNGLSELADEGDVKGITKRINGGYNGLVQRIKLLDKWERILM